MEVIFRKYLKLVKKPCQWTSGTGGRPTRPDKLRTVSPFSVSTGSTR